MMRSTILRAAAALLLSACTLEAIGDAPASGAATADGELLVGANLPWNRAGWDFGRHEQWGAGYDGAFFERAFADLESAGANVARVWVFADGRAAPEWETPAGYDSDLAARGRTAGLEPEVIRDLADLLDRAQAHGVRVIPSLLDFHLFRDSRADAGRHGGAHGAIVTDDNAAAFVDRVVTPLVTADGIAGHPAILAWEIINEPEWAMALSGAGSEPQTVDPAAMRRLVARAAIAIHRAGGRTTVGSASFKWSSDAGGGAVGDSWSDAQLQAAAAGLADADLAYLDLLQIHYYDWMAPWFDPYAKPLAQFGSFDRPVIIGETTPTSSHHAAAEMLSAARSGGYAGVLFWSYGASDGVGGWADFRGAIEAFTGPGGDGYPRCADPASDPDGDGWGWENNQSCRV